MDEYFFSCLSHLSVWLKSRSTDKPCQLFQPPEVSFITEENCTGKISHKQREACIQLWIKHRCSISELTYWKNTARAKKVWAKKHKNYNSYWIIHALVWQPLDMQDSRGYMTQLTTINTCYMLAQADKWSLASSYKLLVKAAIRRTLGGEKLQWCTKQPQTRIEGNGDEGEAGTDESADLMGPCWSATGRPTAAPPGAIGPFRHWARGVARAGCSPWPPRWPGLLQGQKRVGGYGWGRGKH